MVDGLMQSLSLSQAGYSTLLLAVNECKEEVMRPAYNSPDDTSVAFVANALQHANQVLGTEIFDGTSWTPVLSINTKGTSVTWGFRSMKGTELSIDNCFNTMCSTREDIKLITNSKRDEADVAKLLVHSRAKLVGSWRYPLFPWRKFVCPIITLS
jgi:uncharacterized SAM-dependent methyltransferase